MGGFSTHSEPSGIRLHAEKEQNLAVIFISINPEYRLI